MPLALQESQAWLSWAEVVNAVINTLINSAGVTCLNWEEKNPRDELECWSSPV